jgi:hypothetical protein
MSVCFWNGSVWMFWCPACLGRHWWDGRWSWNGDLERPTVRPSVETAATGCHLFLTDGRVTYTDDCRHPLAGRTVTLEPCRCPCCSRPPKPRRPV